MSREQMLRNLILDRYVSLRQFAKEVDIPYSTLMTLLARDIGGVSFDIMIKICRKLEIDSLELCEENYSE
ncbi:MAG: helix-turn-helix transcriptional regulator [Agathobacter sp.]|nr:helix-turn-helix transcriptional regulator [Agathobacter sp.]